MHARAATVSRVTDYSILEMSSTTLGHRTKGQCAVGEQPWLTKCATTWRLPTPRSRGHPRSTRVQCVNTQRENEKNSTAEALNLITRIDRAGHATARCVAPTLAFVLRYPRSRPALRRIGAWGRPGPRCAAELRGCGRRIKSFPFLPPGRGPRAGGRPETSVGALGLWVVGGCPSWATVLGRGRACARPPPGARRPGGSYDHRACIDVIHALVITCISKLDVSIEPSASPSPQLSAFPDCACK